jgi:hypothetical protein
VFLPPVPSAGVERRELAERLRREIGAALEIPQPAARP